MTEGAKKVAWGVGLAVYATLALAGGFYFMGFMFDLLTRMPLVDSGSSGNTAMLIFVAVLFAISLQIRRGTRD